MENLKITVYGKVQGVWFRVKTKEKADELGLNGFVRNQDDGSVYLEVSGKTNIVYKLVNWLHDGSELSRVDKICIQRGKTIYSDGFIIKR